MRPNTLSQRESRRRKKMRSAERKQARERDAMAWPLLEAFRSAADKKAVIRDSLKVWRQE